MSYGKPSEEQGAFFCWKKRVSSMEIAFEIDGF